MPIFLSQRTRPASTFRDAVAVITGAGSGIGRHLALQLAGHGAILALNDNNADRLGETAAEIERLGGKVLPRVYDVGSREETQAFADEVERTFGRVDVVINNAGVALGVMKIEDVAPTDFEWIIRTNLWGVIHGTMAFLPLLRNRPQAHLVNLCSSFGLLAVPRQVAYCTAKFAVRGFTEALRLELAGSGLHVTLVCPSQVRTNIVRDGRHTSEAARDVQSRVFETRFSKVTAEQAAHAILKGVAARRRRVFIGDARIIDFVSRFLPYGIILRGAQREIKMLDQLPPPERTLAAPIAGQGS